MMKVSFEEGVKGQPVEVEISNGAVSVLRDGEMAAMQEDVSPEDLKVYESYKARMVALAKELESFLLGRNETTVQVFREGAGWVDSDLKIAA